MIFNLRTWSVELYRCYESINEIRNEQKIKLSEHFKALLRALCGNDKSSTFGTPKVAATILLIVKRE